jgi:hypothetical protein
MPKKGETRAKIIQRLKEAGVSGISKPFHQLAIELIEAGNSR